MITCQIRNVSCPKNSVKTVFCKVIVVLKTFYFLSSVKCLLFMTFFVWYLASVCQGQLRAKSLNLNQCNLYANVLVTTIKTLEKITHSYKLKQEKKHRLGIAPLKETLPKTNDLFFF